MEYWNDAFPPRPHSIGLTVGAGPEPVEIDFLRASPLDLFEQPVRGVFSSLLA